MNKEELKRVFREYVFTNYDMNDKGIERKYYHSLRVMSIAEQIAINSNFNEKDIEISILVGLLHDYARFPQWTKYKTYSDLKSIDHGDLAVELLFDEEIKKFTDKNEYYDEIYDAIKYHNKISIPNDISLHNEKICMLIRDADKLDIFQIYTKDKEVFKEDDKPLSEDIIKEFYEIKQIDRKKVKSENDNILLGLGLVFDLNYSYSFKYIKENKLIEKMYENIKNKELFKKYFDFTKEYIERRIN